LLAENCQQKVLNDSAIYSLMPVRRASAVDIKN